MAASSMVSVADARARAEKSFDEHWREWAAGLLLERLGRGEAGARVPRLAIALHPPTERQAIKVGRRAGEWASEWRGSSVGRFAEWARREWPRLGAQEVPERVVLTGAGEVARFAGRRCEWELAIRRVDELARCLEHGWGERMGECDASELASATKRSMAAITGLAKDDWAVALRVLGWLAARSGECVYVRQLPIRGIDTKWLESHRLAVEPLYRVLAGGPLPFMKPPAQMRMRVLDAELAPCGLRDVSVLPGELAAAPIRPELVIMSENLVTVLALPDMRGAVAIHGGGYAATALEEVRWLADARVLYWGDIDADGFAILDRVRCRFPHAESVLMDVRTLEAHRDLCVPDPNPRRAMALDRLTDGERAALEEVSSADPPLRLEQERIGWEYALEALGRAKARGGA